MAKMYQQFHPFVDDLKRIRIGVAGRPFSVEEVKSGSLLRVDECDRFRLSFQIADNTVNWEVIFDRSNPLSPPDLIFGPDDEDFSPPLEELKGYYDWDPSSQTCLSDLLTSVVREYSQYRRDGIASLPKISEQWKDLCETTNYAKNCEVYYSSNGPGTYNATASFMFEFTVDLSDIPMYLIRGNIGDNKAILQVSFQSPNLTKVAPKLYLSPKIEHAIGGPAMLRLPPYGASDLQSYVEKVDILLANTVNDVSERFTRRKDLTATFLAEFHGSVIEYDAEGFSEVSLLLNHSGIFFVLYVIIGDKFPASPPSLVVQSIYHMSTKGPYRQTYKDYRYSPRWESKMIVEAIRIYMDSVIPEFKKVSFRNGKMI